MITSMQKLQSLDSLCLAGQESQGASVSPAETPQAGDTATDPRRNPTDGTAHSGTPVMSVKGTENTR